jgi:hypothetical protein
VFNANFVILKKICCALETETYGTPESIFLHRTVGPESCNSRVQFQSQSDSKWFARAALWLWTSCGFAVNSVSMPLVSWARRSGQTHVGDG